VSRNLSNDSKTVRKDALHFTQFETDIFRVVYLHMLGVLVMHSWTLALTGFVLQGKTLTSILDLHIQPYMNTFKTRSRIKTYE